MSHLGRSGNWTSAACLGVHCRQHSAIPHSTAQDVWNVIVLQSTNLANLGSALLQNSVVFERCHGAECHRLHILIFASAFLYVYCSQIVYMSVLSRKTHFIMPYFAGAGNTIISIYINLKYL